MNRKIRSLYALLAFLFLFVVSGADSATLFNYPKFKAHTSTGAPLSGGKLYTYSPGTTTPKATYSDKAHTTANANPTILDAYGEATIYTQGYYKFVLKTSAGTTLWTMDNITGAGSSVLDFSCISDYSNDLAAALTAIGSTPTTLFIDQAVTVSANATIPATVSLHFTQPGAFTVATGVTLTINAPIVADKTQIFTLQGTGSVAGLNEASPEMFGALADGTTNDATAINAAASSLATKGKLILTPGKTYSIEAVISLPTSATLDMTGATIKSHYAGSAIKIGTAGTIIGNGATIYNDVDYAGGLISTTVKNDEAEVKILGWPYIYNGATARYAGSIGIDGEVFHKSHIEAKLAYFETGILIGGGTESNYYNRIMEPFILGCTYGIKGLKSTLELLTLDVAPGTDWTTGDTITGASSGTTAKIYNEYGTTGLIWRIYDRSAAFTDGEVISNGTYSADQGTGYPKITALNSNDLRITDPQINGSNYAKKAIWLDGVGSFSILGGYIEGMLSSSCYGIELDDVSGGSIDGITLDSAASAGNYAIYGCGSSDNVTMENIKFGGAWAGSTLYFHWDATGHYTWQGLSGGPNRSLIATGEDSGSTRPPGPSLRAPYIITGSDSMGGYIRASVESTANIEGDSSTTISLAIPIGAVLRGASLRVESALAAGELWDAKYSGGCTTTIGLANAVAANTKLQAIFNPFASSPVTAAALTHIAITKNGGGSFTAQGTIRAVVWYDYIETAPSL